MPLPSEHFFTRATRYSGGENRLTGALAAVLERVPSLAWTLARSWTQPRQEAAESGEVCGLDTEEIFRALEPRQLIGVDTQVRTPLGDGWVDLELRFGQGATASPDDVLLWIEVKHGVDPHVDQIPKYVRNLPLRGRGTVLLLAPRSFLPYEDEDLVPPSVPQRSWQAVAEDVKKARDNSVLIGMPVEAVKQHFLLEELYIYMQDQHLTNPEVLRPEHLVALAYWDEADGALKAICRWASDHISHRWGPKDWCLEGGRNQVPRYGLGYWEAWNLDAPTEGRLGRRWLDWNAKNDPTAPESSGRSLCFVSGLCVADIADLAPSEEERVRSQRLEEGVEVEGRVVRFRRLTDDHERLAQVAQPEEVLVGATLREQAESLGDWIMAGFKALTLPLADLTPTG